MDLNNVKAGLHVKVVKLSESRSMMIKHAYLDVRKVGVTGTIRAYVQGLGGNVWLVRHDESYDVGAYAPEELEEA
jgi:hypothetical protein